MDYETSIVLSRGLMERRKYYQVYTIGFSSNLKGFSSAEEFSELLDQYLLDTLTVNRLVSPIKTDRKASVHLSGG